jgi:hypothetical protein
MKAMNGVGLLIINGHWRALGPNLHATWDILALAPTPSLNMPLKRRAFWIEHLTVARRKEKQNKIKLCFGNMGIIGTDDVHYNHVPCPIF